MANKHMNRCSNNSLSENCHQSEWLLSKNLQTINARECTKKIFIIKDLNVRPETIKFLEENIGKTLFDINHSRIFYDPPPRILEIKTKINGT